MSHVTVSLALAEFSPYLNMSTGVLELNIPAHDGPIITKDFSAHLASIGFSPREIDDAHDKLAEVARGLQVAKILANCTL